MRKKLLVFADPGIDDSLAIIYALMNPNLEIVGIVTSYGNVSKSQATANAYFLLQLAKQTHIPIIPGASRPVQQDELTFYPEIHGANGIGPISPPEDMKYSICPFDTIRQLVNKHAHNLIIVDFGRSTSLATAMILYHQEFMKVHSFYVMGGAFFVPGNVTALAEANFHGDPASSNHILNNAHNLTITPLNVTNNAILTPDMVEYLVKEADSPFEFLLTPIFDYYYQAYQKFAPGIEGAPIHDLLTVMLVDDPTIADYIFYDAKVIDGTIEAKGHSYIDVRPTSQSGKTRIAIKLNYDQFVENFFRVMLQR
ncbi:Pyrimidine-specific ribonucleoside hydrolase RihA [Bacillus sp. THAF10]|uniref:nucleoside hydrolase n=1 Tax=Bacillus sp. THAF10 TaxID=2587848 RepID=UPI00126867FE|nr:nucleoside hydrolase [Bacillus sp. THAF10]QFT87569.1 Pyrimidine-specific ribonucleoside hydrolase RihA [Bacillus sp. THAF10]